MKALVLGACALISFTASAADVVGFATLQYLNTTEYQPGSWLLKSRELTGLNASTLHTGVVTGCGI